MNAARLKVGTVAALAYIGSILAANWLTTHYGFIPVGFGQVATAGTFAAGATLAVRDLLQDAIGRIGVVFLIAVGALVSLGVSAPAIAEASALAFLLSEALDMFVYTPIRRRALFGDSRWAGAVGFAGVAGGLIDSIVFLWVAFGRSAITGASLSGQLVGKGEVLAAFILVGAATRRKLRPAVEPA